MTDQQTGDWSRLPHDPLGFFGLDESFDRKQLKRSYGALIRRYKPETHPAEFQRIREAFELLDQQLRYGTAQQAQAQQAAAWDAVAKAARADAARAVDAAASRDQVVEVTQPARPGEPPPRPRPQPAPEPAGPSLVELAVDQPGRTYKRLKSAENKSPQDYFVLAVLSDLVEKQSGAPFLTNLLAGLKAHPRDAGLLALLAEYLRADVPLKQAPGVLAAVAAVVSSDLFYRLSEPLWERLLRRQPFDVFRAALDKCERRMGHLDPHSRVVFHLRMLRPALWKAEPEWIDRAISMIEQNGDALDEAAEYDLEFLLLIRAYQREDRGRIRNLDARRKLDDMIRSYCSADWRNAAAAVVTVQDNLARDSHGVIEAFPMFEVMTGESSADGRLLTIVAMITEDVAQQTGLEFRQAKESRARSHAKAALQDLFESVASVGGQVSSLNRRVYGLSFAGLVVAPPLFLFGLLSFVHVLGVLAIWAVAMAVLYFVLIKPKYLDPIVERRRGGIMVRAYETSWRPRLFRYVQACGATGEALQRLQNTAQAEGAGEWMQAVLSYAEIDPGMFVYGRAQAFAT